MIPAKFDYSRASSAEDAVAQLAEFGDDAKLLAGGHSLLPLMKLRLATPARLVDIGRLSELSYVRDGGDHLAIGALTRHRTLETDPLVRSQAKVLAHVAGQVGDPQVRHRGTIGGSISHGDAASDLPAAVLALGGSFVVRSPGANASSRCRSSTADSSRRRCGPTSFSPRSGSPRSRALHGRFRSSTGGRRTGPSSVSSPSATGRRR